MAQRNLDPSLQLAPPQNLEAEMCALGSMILSERAVDLITELLAAEDFYAPAHAEIYKALRSLYMQKRPIDFVTLKDELNRRNSLQDVGGVDYLIQIVDRVPSATNAEHYAEIVRDKAMLRNLEKVGRDIVGIVHDPEGDAFEKINSAEAKVFEVGQRKLGSFFRPVNEIAKEFFKDIDHLMETGQPTLGQRTGYTDFDDLTTGLYPGDLVIVAARPGMGKSSLAMNFALNVARDRVGNVAVFNLEMTGAQLVRRLVATISQVGLGVMRKANMSDRDYEKLTDASEELYDLPLFIDDSSDLSPVEVRAKCRRLKANGGLSLVVIDYLQLMRGPRKIENRTQEIGEIARALKNMAKELGCPVIALSQLNRGVEGRPNKRPMLSDLRESGSIEAEADLVLMIYRDDYYKNRDSDEKIAEPPETVKVAELMIQKHRSGPTGTVLLGWQGAFTRFCLLDDESKFEYRNRMKNMDTDE